MPDLRSLTLKHLRAHEATLRTGSVTAAARELLVTPPAITSQLKLLEALVGAPLFDRSLDGFVPTEIGRLLLATARDVDRLVKTTNSQIIALRSGATGSLVFGAVSTAKYIVPGMVARFQAAHPGISVRLVIGNREDIIHGLERNEFDVLIMGRPPQHLPLVATVLADHPHIVIASSTHRFAGSSNVEPEDLVGERFLSREPGSGTRLSMERFLGRIAIGRAWDIVEMGTNETIKQSVMVGLGIAFISAHTCLAELESGKFAVLKITGLPIVRQWQLIRRSDREASKAAEAFSQFIVEHRKELIPRLPFL